MLNTGRLGGVVPTPRPTDGRLEWKEPLSGVEDPLEPTQPPAAREALSNQEQRGENPQQTRKQAIGTGN